MHATRPLTAIDLFCGAGGLSLGLSYAGIQPLIGVDNDQAALKTYALNHPNTTALADSVETLSGRDLLGLAGVSEVDVVVGGPSCQGFSTHGKRRPDDPRNFLFSEFVRLVSEIQPKYFIMENVKGLLAYSRGQFREVIREAFEEIGYSVNSTTLCAADYGVPQMRHRIMFLGSRLPNADLSFPRAEYGNTELGLPPYLTVSDAIDDLPLMHGDCKRQIWKYNSQPMTRYQEWARGNSGDTLTLHPANTLSLQAQSIARHVGQGEGLRAVPVDQLPKRFQKMRRISTGELRRDCTTLYHRLASWKPAYTITCYYRNVASGPFMHPYEDRSLSHREAARLMSFPDDYQFYATGIPRQIGNAVPPLMAEAIGRTVANLIHGHGKPVAEAA